LEAAYEEYQIDHICTRFISNQVRLALFVLAYNLGVLERLRLLQSTGVGRGI
jgi:hypothetical protein